jgi:hypothetical protein
MVTIGFAIETTLEISAVPGKTENLIKVIPPVRENLIL